MDGVRKKGGLKGQTLPIALKKGKREGSEQTGTNYTLGLRRNSNISKYLSAPWKGLYMGCQSLRSSLG